LRYPNQSIPGGKCGVWSEIIREFEFKEKIKRQRGELEKRHKAKD